MMPEVAYCPNPLVPDRNSCEFAFQASLRPDEGFLRDGYEGIPCSVRFVTPSVKCAISWQNKKIWHRTGEPDVQLYSQGSQLETKVLKTENTWNKKAQNFWKVLGKCLIHRPHSSWFVKSHYEAQDSCVPPANSRLCTGACKQQKGHGT